jgi:hypothetical protein
MAAKQCSERSARPAIARGTEEDGGKVEEARCVEQPAQQQHAQAEEQALRGGWGARHTFE